MANTLVGVYDDFSQAQAAMNALIQEGFASDRVTLNPSAEQATTTRATASSRIQEDDSGGIGDKISDFFRSLFGGASHEEGQADVYSEAVRRGNYVLTVHAESEDQSERAIDILNRYEPVDLDERAAQWQGYGGSGYGTTPLASEAESTRSTSAGRQAGSAISEETAIPIIQEELQVGKREVARGGVRVHQHIVETPVEEQVRLREEHVTVERRPVDQPASQADLAAMKEGSFELRETAEEAVVSKTAHVVEEVVVGKETTERTKTVSDKVRRTEVEVEKVDS